MMKRKLTSKERDMITDIQRRLFDLVLLEKWTDKTVQALNDIRKDNADVGGPDLRKKDFTKQMNSEWEMGQDYIGKAVSKLSTLNKTLRKKIRSLIDRAKRVDPTFST